MLRVIFSIVFAIIYPLDIRGLNLIQNEIYRAEICCVFEPPRSDQTPHVIVRLSMPETQIDPGT